MIDDQYHQLGSFLLFRPIGHTISLYGIALGLHEIYFLAAAGLYKKKLGDPCDDDERNSISHYLQIFVDQDPWDLPLQRCAIRD
jgi:hypothetical protein